MTGDPAPSGLAEIDAVNCLRAHTFCAECTESVPFPEESALEPPDDKASWHFCKADRAAGFLAWGRATES